jgi:hypothetical protein
MANKKMTAKAHEEKKETPVMEAQYHSKDFLKKATKLAKKLKKK